MGKLLTASDKKQLLDELKLIDEQISHVTLELVEGTGEKTGKVYARGEFGHASKPTANGRLYPHGLWESNIQRLSTNLSERKVLGELDHPSDGRTALQRASHVITDLRLEHDRVIGEAEILDTAMGRDLKAILEAGVPVGISSRGYGSTKSDGKGKEVVQEDYKLVTFDFVAEPADNTAYPDVFFEGVEFPEDLMDESTKTDVTETKTEDKDSTEDSALEESMAAQISTMSDKEKALARKFLDVAVGIDTSEKPAEKPAAAPAVVEPAVNMEALKKDFSAQILSKIGAMRGELEEEIRREMLADPAVGGARGALEQVSRILRPFILPEDVNEVVEAKEEEIAGLRRQLQEQELKQSELEGLVEKLAEAAKESGYKYHMERLISGESESDLLRTIVGDVTQYENAEEITSKVEEARVAADSRRLEEDKVTRVQSAQTTRVEEKSQVLAEGLEEALGVNKQLALRLYAAERLQTHPKAAKIHRMLETNGYHSQDQIDTLIEEFREPARDQDDLADIRARIRSKLQGGAEYVQEDVRPRNQPGGAGTNYNGLGMTLDSLKRLSGLDNR